MNILQELAKRLADYVEWHESAIPRNHRDDYEQEYLIEGSKVLIKKAASEQKKEGGTK